MQKDDRIALPRLDVRDLGAPDFDVPLSPVSVVISTPSRRPVSGTYSICRYVNMRHLCGITPDPLTFSAGVAGCGPQAPQVYPPAGSLEAI